MGRLFRQNISAHGILSIHDFEGDLFCESRGLKGRENNKKLYYYTNGNIGTKPLKRGWEKWGGEGWECVGGAECYLLMFHDPLAHYSVSNMNPLLL